MYKENCLVPHLNCTEFNLNKYIYMLKWLYFFSFFFILFILFLAVSGLHRCVQPFSSCGERGLLFIAVHGLLIAVASLVVERGL